MTAHSVGADGDPISDRDPGTPQALADRLSAFARQLAGETDTDATLTSIVRAAVEMIPGAEDGSLTVVRSRRFVESQFATGDLPRELDRLQEALGEGPCLTSAFEQRTVLAGDLRNEPRWPQFAEGAVRAGALSMMCFQLFVNENNLGALNLVSTRATAFDASSEDVGRPFAAHAAIAFASARKEANFSVALESRDLIGQAKGILIERFTISPEQAFLVLVRASRESNLKLREVAEVLIRTGQTPGSKANSSA